MAVEEAEYYSLHQGNGMSGGIRGTKSKKAAPKRKAVSGGGSRSGMTSFFQGITLGAVLLIPVGVWCWVRVGELAPPAAESAEVTTKGKQGRAKSSAVGTAAKRKPMRAAGASTVVPAPQGAVARPKSLAGPVELPPAIPVAAPEGVGVAPVAPQIPRVAEQFDETAKPKKNVWKTLSVPFRGKSTKPPATGQSVADPGGPQ